MTLIPPPHEASGAARVDMLGFSKRFGAARRLELDRALGLAPDPRPWFTPPEHLSYFNQENLNSFISACGYRLLSLQANFPIEIFLTNTHSNYWRDRSLGKQAHFSRVFCENHLINKNIDNYIRYAEASAALGFGRELIAYVTPN